ncbi:hypothetical protein [Clostridium ljungdahlii]|uniref:hypothetical protein n=1 Tax=Clostridium ljungdahlii TaxID=1538 RepID=UPI00386DBE28
MFNYKKSRRINMFLILILSLIFLSIVMILSYHNKKDSLIEPIATIIASIIAVLGVMKTIDNNNKSNQKMRITQVITKAELIGCNL